MDTEGRGLRVAGEQAGRAQAAGRGRAQNGIAGDGMRRVALEEMALRRRRLGELTPAQERALEALLLTVADNISGLVSAVAASAPRSRPGEEVGAPQFSEELRRAA